MANVIPNVDNIPTAAKPIPYNPSLIAEKLKCEANPTAKDIPTTTANTGIMVEAIPSPRPPIMTGPAPVSAFSAIRRVGLYSAEV